MNLKQLEEHINIKTQIIINSSKTGNKKVYKRDQEREREGIDLEGITHLPSELPQGG